MGIIESIEMTQFMCHKYLTFSLGPQINFIIGAFTPSSCVVAVVDATRQAITEVSADAVVDAALPIDVNPQAARVLSSQR